MPISANQTLSFDGRMTMTLNRWMQRKLRDVFLGNSPLWAKLQAKGLVVDGGLGSQIVEPLLVPAPGGPQAEGIDDPYADRDHVPMTGITSAYYTPAEVSMLISVPKRELKLQGSETKRVDFVEGIFTAARKRFFSKLRRDLWRAEGATNGAGGQSQVASIRVFLNRGGSSTTAGTDDEVLTNQIYNGGTAPGGGAVGSSPITLVGGIERNAANNAFWSTPLIAPSASDVLTLITFNSGCSLATREEDSPDLCFIGRDGFDKLVTILQGAGYSDLWNVPDVMKKFRGCRYRGMDIFFDDNVPAGTGSGTNPYQIFYINTDYLKLVVDSWEPEVEYKNDPRRPLKGWEMDWYGQLTSGHLGRVHARHTSMANS